MPSLSERILPELTLLEPGPERQRMFQQAVNGPRTRVAAILVVVGPTGLFILWDKLVASIPSSWSLYLMLMLYLLGLGAAIWFTRRGIRRRLREQLAKKGVPVCIPCGYNLTGNESGVCPECGTPMQKSGPLGTMACGHDESDHT